MSHILVLSAHDTQLDRRISAEANALVASGREVTLLSVPTRFPIVGLDPRVKLIVEPNTAHEKKSFLKTLIKKLPFGLSDHARALWYHFGSGPAPYNKSYFLANVPPEQYDGVHCHDLKTLPAGVEIRKRHCIGAPIIYDSHELFPFQSRDTSFQKYWIEVENRFIREADQIITINDSLANELQMLYTVPRPEVIYNSYGIDSSAQPLRRDEFLEHFKCEPNDRKVVLFQGGLTAGRNLDNLVKAFADIKSRANLFLLGRGPIEEALKGLCSKKKIQNVFFGDWVPQEELLRYVSCADMGVIPYVGDDILNNYYCTPNKLFEYIEARVPICASDLPELRSIVRGRGIGNTYTMDDPSEIAAAIDNCLERLAKGEFDACHLDAAREEFSWAGQEQTLLRIYAELGL